MSKRTLRHVLEWLYKPQHDIDAPDTKALEADVMEAYGKRFGGKHRGLWFFKPQSSLARMAMASVLLIAVLGVACELPTSAQVDMGQHIVVQVRPHKATDDMRTFESELNRALINAGAEKVRISFGRVDAQHMVMDIVAWDEDLSAKDVENLLQEQIGADNVLTVDITALSGTVSEPLRHRMLRQFFGFDVANETAEELRARILQRLAEQGFAGNAHVEVQDEGSMRKITIEAESADGSQETTNEIIIERKDK